MSGKTIRIFTLSILLAAGALPAWAETATESVTVSASKLRRMFHTFEDTFQTPTALGDKLARWERRICPVVVGQSPHVADFIRQRIKYIALAAGAPINAEPSCQANIEVVFTTTPQALLDNVRQHAVDYLGYAASNAQLAKLATVTRPVQAWYTTETRDNNGRRLIDSDIVTTAGGGLMFLPTIYGSSGGHIGNGMTSGFNHIMIVIDSAKVAGEKIVPLSDYIAMLALTQIKSLDACQQQQPSVVNMLAAGCDHAQDGLSAFDLAYLQGLYGMSASRGLLFQRNDIAAIMTDKLIDQPIAVRQ